MNENIREQATMGSTDSSRTGSLTELNLIVSVEQKEQWIEFHESNPEYSTLSDLIRVAVTREIQRKHEDSESTVSPEVQEDITELRESIDGLTEAITELSEDMTQVQNQVNET